MLTGPKNLPKEISHPRANKLANAIKQERMETILMRDFYFYKILPAEHAYADIT